MSATTNFSTDALTIIEAAPDALVIVNIQGRIVHFNAQAQTLFGYQKDEVEGRPIEVLIPERFRERHSKHISGYFGHPRIRPMGAGLELSGLKKNGKEFPLEISLSPLNTATETLTLAAVRDITDRKKAEAKFRGILEATPDALLIINHLGKIVLVNAQVENLFGYQRAEILEQPIETLMPERFRHKHEFNRTHYFHHPHIRPMAVGSELYGRKKNGDEFPVEISLSPLDSEEGMWALAAVRDATQRMNIERTLQENNNALQKAMEQLQLQTEEKLSAEKKLAEQNIRVQMAEEYRARQEEFINTICHEIRNPMTGIYGNIDFLQQTGTSLVSLLDKLNEEDKPLLSNALDNLSEITREIEQCVKHQKAIIDDVLDLSKLEIGKFSLSHQPFRLKSVMEETAAIFSAPLSNKKLQLLLEVPSQDIWVKGDANRLKMVLVNLLANALKFTEHGYITFKMQIKEVSPIHTSFCIDVEDSGIGMTQEEVAQLFQPFARVAAAEYEGSGLGLLISKRFIERMGGQISVTSQKGKGTVFSISLACETAMPEVKQVSPTATLHVTTSVPPKRVLVVEDNTVNQRILCRQLSQFGHVVDVACNGQEAVDKYSSAAYDVIFMDIEMPVMSGLEATKNIRKLEEVEEIPQRTPIIGLSAYAHIESVRQAHQAGMDDYITKPYEKEKVQNAVIQWTQHQLPKKPDTNKRRLPFSGRNRPE